MGQLSSRSKKATFLEHEQQPCVLLKYTTTTAENHLHQLDETPGGAGEIEETNEAGRDEKKMKTSRRFRFFRKRAGKYDLVQAEKVYQNEAGSYQKITDGKVTHF